MITEEVNNALQIIENTIVSNSISVNEYRALREKLEELIEWIEVIEDELRDEPIYCSSCSGIGYDPRTDKVCKRCNGTGVIKMEVEQ